MLIESLDFAVATPGAAHALMKKWGYPGTYTAGVAINELVDRTPFLAMEATAERAGAVYKNNKLVFNEFEVWFEGDCYFVRVTVRDLYKRVARVFWAPGSHKDMPVKVNRDFTTTLRVVYAITACEAAGVAEGALTMMDMARDRVI